MWRGILSLSEIDALGSLSNVVSRWTVWRHGSYQSSFFGSSDWNRMEERREPCTKRLRPIVKCPLTRGLLVEKLEHFQQTCFLKALSYFLNLSCILALPVLSGERVRLQIFRKSWLSNSPNLSESSVHSPISSNKLDLRYSSLHHQSIPDWRTSAEETWWHQSSSQR